MKTYQIQQLYNCMYGFLKGTRKNNISATTKKVIPRTMTQIFLCENCDGRGYFRDKHDDFGTECTCCDGAGRIRLEFSVKRVDLESKFEIIKEKQGD